jgi:hypothetical protein
VPRRFVVQTRRGCVTAVALAGQELCFLWRMNSMNLKDVTGCRAWQQKAVAGCRSAGRLETEMYSEGSAHYLLGP